MHYFASSLVWCLLPQMAVVAQAFDATSNSSTTSSTTSPTISSMTCDSFCSVGGPDVTIYGWATPDVDNRPWFVLAGYYTVTSTWTIVTAINTALNGTTTTTQFPTDYTPPPTNDGGTRIETISYSREGKHITTTLAFPTIFVVWPDYYDWSGTLKVSGVCITNDWNTRTLIATNPQPDHLDGMYLFRPNNASDPRGLSHSLISDRAFRWEYSVLSPLFPDQPALTTCTDDNSGPNWGGFTQTLWMSVTSTVYTSSMPSKTASVIGGGAVGGESGGGSRSDSGGDSGSSSGGGSGGGSTGSIPTKTADAEGQGSGGGGSGGQRVGSVISIIISALGEGFGGGPTGGFGGFGDLSGDPNRGTTANIESVSVLQPFVQSTREERQSTENGAASGISTLDVGDPSPTGGGATATQTATGSTNLVSQSMIVTTSNIIFTGAARPFAAIWESSRWVCLALWVAVWIV